MVGQLLLLLVFTIAAQLFGNKPPIPNSESKTHLAPRAVTYFSYQFPPRDDLSSRAVLSHSKTTMQTLFPANESIFDNATGNTVDGPAIDWASELKQDWIYQAVGKKTTFSQTTQFHSANPAHRQTERPGDDVCGSGWLGLNGTRFVQLMTEPGFPIDVPTYTCGQKTDSVQGALVLTKRDFMTGQSLSSRLERHLSDVKQQESLAISYPAQILAATLGPIGNNYPKAASLLQAATKDSGGQIWTKDGTYNLGTGRLQLAPMYSFLLHFDQWTAGDKPPTKIKKWQNVLSAIHPWFGWGMTVQFESWNNGDIDEGDLIVNVDTLVRMPTDLSKPLFPRENVYSSYESWLPSWNMSQTVDPVANLQLDIVWSDWSCCSSCCCSQRMCGSLETRSKCAVVNSTKTRKGYLSLKKVVKTDPVDLTKILESELEVNEQFPKELELLQQLQRHVEKMFGVSPYRENGIPLYSTVIPIELRKLFVQKHFEPIFLRSRNWTEGNYTGLGQFILTASCDTDPQKKNCRQWAKCRGHNLKDFPEVTTPEPEQYKDPCSGVSFVTLNMDELKNWFRIEPGQNYRLQVAEMVFPTQSVTWKVAGKQAPDYKASISCEKQGIVSLRQLLLFMNNTELDNKLTIEAYLDTGRVIEAFLQKEEKKRVHVSREDGQEMNLGIICGVCIGVSLLLALAIVLDWHCYVKRKLKKKAILNKETTPTTGTDASA